MDGREWMERLFRSIGSLRPKRHKRSIGMVRLVRMDGILRR
jgi:hypothetical protein